MQDEVSPDRPITYALVANHGAEVQREAALLFLYQLVYRQSGLRNVMHGSDSDRASRIARAAVEADARAERTFLDRSLGGWRKATDALALEAAELVWFVNEPVL
jgi:hypothetical protein